MQSQETHENETCAREGAREGARTLQAHPRLTRARASDIKITLRHCASTKQRRILNKPLLTGTGLSNNIFKAQKTVLVQLHRNI